MLIYNFRNIFLGALKLKLNKLLVSVFILKIFCFGACLAQNENPDSIAPDSEHLRPNIQNELSPPEPKPNPEPPQEDVHENKPAAPPVSQEEKKAEAENITRILKNKEKKQEASPEQTEQKKTKKIEESKEKNSNTEETEKKEPETSVTSNYLPETPNEEPDDFKSNIPSRENSKKKEYIIKGIISMILVIAGAILLVIVIITGVNNSKISKKAKRAKRKKKFFDKKGE